MTSSNEGGGVLYFLKWNRRISIVFMAEAQKLADMETRPIQLQMLPNEDISQPKGKFEEINMEALDLTSPKRFYSQ